MAASVIQVIYDSGTAPAEDVTNEALSPGNKLYTRNYSAPGTYTVTMVSGDDDEYQIDPTCEATFVINE